MDISGIGKMGSAGDSYKVESDKKPYGIEKSPKEVVDRYNFLLNKMLELLKKKNDTNGYEFTEEDALELQDALNELLELRNQNKLEISMFNDLNQLLFFLNEAGLNTDKVPVSIDVAMLNKLRNFELVVYDKKKGTSVKINVFAALISAIPEGGRPLATKNIGDALLDIASMTEAQYNEKMKELEAALKIAKDVLKNLSVLKEILNQTTTADPQYPWTWPVEHISDMPKEVQQELMDKKPPIIVGYNIVLDKDGKEIKKTPIYMYATNEDGTPYLDADGNKIFNTSHSTKIFEWIGNNRDEYMKMSAEWMAKAPPVKAAPKEDGVYRLITARDELLRLLAELKAAGAESGEGSQIDSIQKLVDSIDKEFPRIDFPVGCAENWKIPVEDADGNVISYTYKYPAKADDKIKAWIEKSKSIGEDVNVAVQINSNLGSETSDKMKELNLKLQQTFDLLSQIQKAWQQIIMGMAQKIAR